MSFATYIEIKKTIDPYNNFNKILSGGDLHFYFVKNFFLTG